jgi:class 3 adenylate cyclase/tetratricopeptide (TPR) repeat protein
LGRKVALKVLPADLSADETFRRRFVTEARTAATMQHPGIVTVYEAGESDGLLYISMAHIWGTDLARMLAKDGPMTPERLLPIVAQIADALDAAHERGFVHRDVKPANILIELGNDRSSEWRAYLSDFGVAKPLHSVDGPTKTGEFVGTVDYVAPEQIRGEAVDGRADQYSLACVLVEGLTGERVFPREMGIATIYAHLGEAPPSLHRRNAVLPHELDRAVGRGLAKAPADRYESCRALVEGVRSASRSAIVGSDALQETASPDRVEKRPPTGYTPKYLSGGELESPTVLEGERKQVTVLFCDIAGSTALAERIGPDAMHALLDAFFERMLGHVHRHGGTINQFLGDGFMALFGAPLAYEDHAKRAALAGWNIQEGLRRDPIRPPDGTADAITVRIGLNTGLVVVGKIGDDLRMDYTAIGDTTNLAARLQVVAEAGTVLLSESTRRAAADAIRTIPLGEKQLKGKTEVAVHRLEGPTTPRRVTRVEGRPMVGRRDEVATITRAVRDLEGGHGGLVLISGEAGIGKSRLIAELAATRPAAIRWLEGRSLSFGESTAYWPFLEVIRQTAAVLETDGEPEAWRKVRARVVELFPDTWDEMLPYLATFLGLRVRDSLDDRIRYLDERAMGSHVLFSCRRFFDALAAELPTVLVFEDVHWMDRSSLELLERLLPLAISGALLIAATARSGSPTLDRLRQAAAGSRGLSLVELALRPLGIDASTQLLRELAGAGSVSDRDAEVIVAKAGGNPLFLEEVTRSLMESGRLGAASAGAPRASGELGLGLVIPGTIRDVVMARVDRVGAELKETVRVASVIGRVVPARILEEVIGVPATEVARRLRSLQELDLLVEIRRAGEPEHAFKHALVQEAVFQSIVLPRRRELHVAVARAIERVFSDRLEEFYSVLAHHYAEAKDWQQAQAYLFRAGDEAIRVAADAEALGHYERALQTYALAFGDTLEPVQRVALERKIGDALFRLGRHDQAIERLLRSLERVGHTYPDSPRALSRAIAREFVRQSLHRRSPRAMRRRPAMTEDLAIEVYTSYRALSWMHYFMDPMSFGLDVLRSLNVAQDNGYRFGVSMGSAGVGLALDVLRRPRMAIGYIDRSLRIAEDLAHPIAIGEASLAKGVHEFVGGDLPGALASFTRSQDAYRDAGDLRGWGVSRTLESWVHRLQGRFDVSLAAGADAQKVAVDAGDADTRGWALEDQARTLCMIGTLDHAIELCLEALEVFRSIPAPFGISDTLADLGSCYLRRGELDLAIEALEEAGRFVHDSGVKGYNATQVLAFTADYHVVALEGADDEERREASGRAARASRAIVRNSKWVPLAVCWASRTRGTYEWLRGNPASALRWWRRSTEAGERVGDAVLRGPHRARCGPAFRGSSPRSGCPGGIRRSRRRAGRGARDRGAQLFVGESSARVSGWV